MKCYGCGNTITKEMMFCPVCGKPQGFDAELIRRAGNGEQDALTELYNRTYDGVYQTIRAMVKDEDTALDILQDSYIKAFNSLDKLQEPNKFRAWVKRIAHNRTVDYLRKTKPIMFSSMVSADSDEMVEFADERLSVMPDAVMDQNETTRLVSEILDELPEDQRAVTVMHYFDDVPVSEIAAQLGVSENTVKSRLNYARQKIKAKVIDLEKRGTKLYGLAPIPFLLFLFRNMEAQTVEIPSQTVCSAICSRCVSGGASTGQPTAGNLPPEATAGQPQGTWQTDAAAGQTGASTGSSAAETASGGAAGAASGGASAVAATAATSAAVKIIAVVAAAACAVAVGTAAYKTVTGSGNAADSGDGGSSAVLSGLLQTETETEDGTTAAFKEQLAAIVTEHGLFADSQSASVAGWDSYNWLDCSGVMAATIFDFDSDGQDEMLVCIAENLDINETYCDIDLYMWEVEDGGAVLADVYANGDISTEAISDLIIMYHTLPTDDGCYILCERCYGPEWVYDIMTGGSVYWIVEYTDGSFQKVAEYTQPGGYAEDNIGTEYENGEVVSSQVYYNDIASEGEALYDDSDEAMTAFFEKYGIRINMTNAGTTHSESVYAPMLDDAELIFDFQNTMTDTYVVEVGEWNFSATLSRGNDLLDEEGETGVDSTSSSVDNASWQEAYKAILQDTNAWILENLLETDSPWFTVEYLEEYPLNCEYVCLDLGNDKTPELILRSYSEAQTANYWFFIAYDEADGAYIIDQSMLDFRANIVLWEGSPAWMVYHSYDAEGSLGKIVLTGREFTDVTESVTVNLEEESLPETEAVIYFSTDDMSGIGE